MAPSPQPWKSGVTATLIAHNCQPVGYAPTGSLIYNSINPNGYWDAYINGKSLTAPGPGLVWTHRGGSDVRDNQLLLTAARMQILGSAPGQGAANNIVLMDLDTSTISTPVGQREGVFWARWHPTLDRICWAEQVKTDVQAPPFGTQNIHVADVTAAGGIANEIVLTANLPAGFYECYGWTRDASQIIFASDAASSQWLQTTFYTLPDTAGATTLPTPLMPSGYHEFAFVPPLAMFNDGADSLLVGYASGSLGLELWRLILTTGAAQRLTYFNPGYALGVGGLTFDPINPKKLAIGYEVPGGGIDGYELVMP